MAKQSIFERMTELAELIKHHSWLYHVENRQEIENDVYDEFQREFNALCDDHPELAVKFDIHDKPVPISEPTGEGLSVVKFTEPMRSLKKGFGFKEVEKFIESFEPNTSFVYEVKLDGLALELTYIKGVLMKISTRGAGMVGEDVTHALPLFLDWILPKTIETELDEFRVRGEGYISIEAFNKYNEMVEEKKSNPRNAVSGWIRSSEKNQDKKALGSLSFAAYWSSDRLDAETYGEWSNNIMAMGFLTPPNSSLERVKQNLRGSTVPSDGVVIKVNNFELQDRVGETNQYPRYALAYKFPHEEGFPKVEDAEWNTSRFGRVIPVVIYSSVVLGGVICNRASLDNYSGFMEMGLSIGDTISVTRNNDVIPRINGITEPVDDPNNKLLLKAPTECPSCSSVLEVRVGKGATDLICTNVSGCPGQLVARCVNLVNKFAFDIDGLGPILLGDMVDRGFVRIPSDIFELSLAGKNYLPENVNVEIEMARHQPLHRFIKGLGLPNVGVVLSKRLANAIGDRDKFSTELLETLLLDIRFLTSIRGISSGIAMKIVSAFDNPNFEESFWKLAQLITIDSRPLPGDDFKVCITGSFDQNRDELVEHFAGFGLELTDKLTKDCKSLIVGERPGKAKLLKATELGITMLKASDFSSFDNLITFIKDN